MNAQGRKQFAALQSRIGELIASIEEVQNEMASLAEAEQEKFDNMPESLQDGDRGQAMQAVAEKLDSFVSSLDSAKEALEEIDDLEV